MIDSVKGGGGLVHVRKLFDCTCILSDVVYNYLYLLRSSKANYTKMNIEYKDEPCHSYWLFYFFSIKAT